MKKLNENKILSIFLLMLLSFSACTNNITLEKFDLGNGRFIKVTTGTVDNGLPIYYEMYSNDVLIQKCYIYTKSSDNEELQKLKFKLLNDKSKNIFLLMQEEPEKEQVAVVEFTSGFRYPCCSNDHGAHCKTEYNRLVDLLEQDNPELKLERLLVPSF